MTHHDRSTNPHDSADSTDGREPAPRGFGDMSGGYRARWALSHPDMQTQWRTREDIRVSSSPAFEAGGGEPAAEARPTGDDALAPMPNDCGQP
jgi:hypothetical protein